MGRNNVFVSPPKCPSVNTHKNRFRPQNHWKERYQNTHSILLKTDDEAEIDAFVMSDHFSSRPFRPRV
jgi:hypothetical protein